MSTTTDLTTLKINYLTQAQYDAAVSGGTIEENEIYMTPNGTSSTTCTIGSGWTNYNTGEDPMVFRYGNVCMFQWACKPTTAINPLNTTSQTVCTIPSGYRPSRNLYFLEQSSQTAFFHFTINTDGTVKVSRLRDVGNSNNAYSNATTATWFPITATYVCSN